MLNNKQSNPDNLMEEVKHYQQSNSKKYFQVKSVSVEAIHQKNLYDYYQVKEPKKVGHPPKIWGIDSMSTALSMSLARIYYNPEKIPEQSNRESEKRNNFTQQKRSINQMQNKELNFEYSQLGGILCFIADRRRRVHQMRLFDINSYKLLFQCEIYINMHKNYRELQPNFHCFPLPSLVLGIEFSHIKDAMMFSLLVNQYCPKLDDDQTLFNFQQLQESKDKLLITSKYISRPTSVIQKETPWFNHITQTFNLEQLPNEIKILIKQIGIKKKDLKNPDKAKSFFDIIQQFGLDGIDQNPKQNEDIESEIPKIQPSIIQSNRLQSVQAISEIKHIRNQSENQSEMFQNNFVKKQGSLDESIVSNGIRQTIMAPTAFTPPPPVIQNASPIQPHQSLVQQNLQQPSNNLPPPPGSIPLPPNINQSIPPPPKNTLNLPPLPPPQFNQAIRKQTIIAPSQQQQTSKPLTLAEQLQLQREKMNEQAKNATDLKMQNMSEQKKVELITKLAQTHTAQSNLQKQLDERKKLLSGRQGDKKKGSDSSGSNHKSDSSDGSGW